MPSAAKSTDKQLTDKQLTAGIAQLQQQFMQLWSDAALTEPELALDLLQQFEQTLLQLVKQAKPNDELGRYIQAQLEWLRQQMLQVNSEKNVVSDQLLQITRARKGNASYDKHKSG